MSGSEHTRARVCVVGAGIGGLVAAMRLEQSGARVDLFEATARAGGHIETIHDQGYRMEFGPNTIPDRDGVISDLIDTLGIASERVQPNAHAKKRFIVRNERLHALPMSPLSFVTTPLFSARAKMRLLAEPFISGEAPAKEESVHALTSRRLGQEIADYAIDPFIAGTYAGDPKTLSSHHVLARLRELEREHGSLLGGAFRSKRAKSSSGGAKRSHGGGALVNFARGVQTLPDAIVDALEATIHFERPIERIERLADGTFEVTPENLKPHAYDRVVVVVPACALTKIELVGVGQNAIDTAPIHQVKHPPVTMLALGFERAQIAHPLDGFGLLVPSLEPFRILGAVFASTIFEQRAPEGHALLMVFLGGRSPADALLDEAEQVRVAMEDLGKLLGISGEPAYVRSKTWAQSIPQYEIGHERVVERASEIERLVPGLFLEGTWQHGVSVADTVRKGNEVAERVMRSLGD